MMHYLHSMKNMSCKVFVLSLPLMLSQLAIASPGPNAGKYITITNKTGQTNTFYFMVDKISKIPD